MSPRQPHHLAAPGRPVPVATYRLQLSGTFTFADAAELAGYLSALGVSHAYLSPVLQAAPFSAHGYDVVDHGRIAAGLGGEDGLRRLAARLREHGLGVIADIVPNHMAVPVPESLNHPLWSVLRDGPSSPYAAWFDIDWPAQGGKLLLPVLGRRIGECVAAGEITVDMAGEEALVRYYDHVLPVRSGTAELPLPELLQAQWYRLAYWRVAQEELNYRRFFDIHTLAGLRVEDPEVFAATHRLVCTLLAEGVLDGLRVDHPDGLADPRGYLGRLAEATGGSWVVVEKILEGAEELPADWLCAGTTGYDAARVVGGLFVDPDGAAPMTATYLHFTGGPAEFAPVAAAAKRQVLTEVLPAELGRLTDLAVRISRADVALGDHTPGDLRDAIRELLVAVPVYRSYLVPDEQPGPLAAAATDLATVEAAAALAGTRLAARQRGTLELVRDLALGLHGTQGVRGEFVVRFQQTSAAAMAKGVEDTAFYRWSRLASLCDVGSDPVAFGVLPEEFHAFCATLQRDWPRSLTALSTHDSKRSEDVRARLAVLSELPGEWQRAAFSWSAAAGSGPDQELEYLLWQTLIGILEPGRQLDDSRLAGYLRKAMREAKRRTSWLAPDEGYEAAVLGFARRVLEPPLRAQVDSFVARIARYARVNTLGQKLLQLTMPGVPDLYQGTELTALTLVDPDNRRPVDFGSRRALLARLDDGKPPRDLDEEKLLVTSRALRLRRDLPREFGPDASYRPVAAVGPAARHVVAFLRDERVAAVATRLAVSLERGGGWGLTVLDLPAGRWRDVLGGAGWEDGRIRVADLLGEWPVALLVRDRGG